MAATGNYGSKSMDPESAKRLASGVWKHEHRLETGEDIWTCNVALLRDKLHQMACSDRRMYKQYCKNPDVFLDARFGDMTAEAFSHYTQGDRISLRTRPEYDYFRRDKYLTMMNTTFTNAHTIRQPKKEETIKFERKLVRNLPFVHGGDSVADTLQREFDWWAGEQLKHVRSWVA